MAEMATAATEEQLVAFELGDEIYGVEIGRVQEIIRMTEITKLPKAPLFVEGVINLRGRVIPVVDLKKRFEFKQTASTAAGRIVVVDIGDHTIGMVVDGVSEVLRVPASSIEPPSPVVMTVQSDYIRGIAKLEGRLIILLNLDKVLARDEQQQLKEVA